MIKTILSGLTILLALLVFAPNTQADFVVDIDDYVSTPAEGFASRTVFDPSEGAVTNIGNGFVANRPLGGLTPITFEYDFGANTFADLIYSLPNGVVSNDAIAFFLPVFANNPSDWNVELELENGGGGTTSLFSGTPTGTATDRQEIAYSGAIDPNQVKKINLIFNWVGSTVGPSTQITFGGTAGNFIATPEPTSLLMFGSIVALGFSRRRRRR